MTRQQAGSCSKAVGLSKSKLSQELRKCRFLLPHESQQDRVLFARQQRAERGRRYSQTNEGRGIRTVTVDSGELAVDQNSRGEDLAEDWGFEMLKWAEGRVVEAATTDSHFSKVQIVPGVWRVRAAGMARGGLGIGNAEWYCQGFSVGRPLTNRGQ